MLITPEKIEQTNQRVYRQYEKFHAAGMTQQCLFRPWDTAYCMDVIQPAAGMKILEIGAGAMHSYLAFLDAGADVIVTDSMEWQDRRNREIAAGKTPQSGLPDIEQQQHEARVVTGVRAFKLDIQDKTDCIDNDIYDAIYSISAIEHAEQIEASLANIYRILKPGGMFAVTTETSFVDKMPWIGPELFIRIFHVSEFTNLLMKAGFFVYDISPDASELANIFAGEGTGENGTVMLMNHFFGTVGYAAIKPK